ncbi:MAG TPA: EscU/YscU/HrcU family type III secretion system export apparatus switch protein, partial [Polyangia bacterium]|nr:EscU/YscU/HrcU family type III secretion system export apparatus switch protein [Polyangia bacterium]
MAASGEPTEEPTQKRLEEARGRGEVAYSRDLVSAAAMTAALVALIAGGPESLARLLGYWKEALAAAPAGGAP